MYEIKYYEFRLCIFNKSLAENFELLGTLLTQLDWLLRSVVYGDANELLACYRDFHSKVPQNVSKLQLQLHIHVATSPNNMVPILSRNKN